MKKFFLSMVALVAMSTTSFAQYSQYFTVYQPTSCSVTTQRCNVSSLLNSMDASVLTSLQSVSSTLPSSVNINTISVSGYTRSNGTYVLPHVRTVSNDTNWDNFSTKGNSNPFTGSTGYRAKDYTPAALNYGGGHIIHTGSRGGQYYYNSRGNKTYVPKRSIW